MEVFEVVKLAKGGKVVQVNISDLECQMLLTFAINQLIDRGSMTLLSPEDQEHAKGLEELLSRDTEGSA